MDLTYTEPKARRARQLAAREDFQTEKGDPNIPAIASQVGVSTEACRYILTGKLPAKAGAKKGEDPLS